MLSAPGHRERMHGSRVLLQSPYRERAMSERDKPGVKSRPVTRRNPANDDERLDEALKETFPASDPPAPVHPNITGWDLDEAKAEDEKGRRDERSRK
jgi:hypothetical protein